MLTIPVKLTIDTNCINARGSLPAMNILERWAHEGRVVLLATERLRYEANYTKQARQKAHTMRHIGEPAVWDESFYDVGAYMPQPRHPDFVELASVLFQGRDVDSLAPNDRNDVMHLLSHYDGGGDIFVTNDTKDFVKGGRRELLREKWGIVVMTAEEVIAHLKERHDWK